MSKHFGKNQLRNNFFGNVGKHSEKRLPIFQKIINHIEKRLGKQNNHTMHYQGNGQQGNLRFQNFSH
jgi:hypothetical protein